MTLQVCISRCTLTQIAVDLVYTGTAVLTGGASAFVDIFKKGRRKISARIAATALLSRSNSLKMTIHSITLNSFKQ